MRALIIGGAASGKSEYAEQLITSYSASPIYIATMKPYGKDAHAKIDRHKKMRASKGFTTLENYSDLSSIDFSHMTPRPTILIECLSNICANVLFEESGLIKPIDVAFEKISDNILRLARESAHIVVIGNDVGCPLENTTPEIETYQRLIGRVECELAAQFDTVIECRAGQASILKGAQ